jgi:two-component system OmpR family response regulator
MEETKTHIAVVDDHRDIREPLSLYFEKQGFRVSKAANGAELNKILKVSSIDLVILDILMPGESGLTICRRIRETKDIPIILLTAISDQTDKIVGLEMGADDYITKPFDPRELLARVTGVLRRTNSLPKQFTELESGTFVFGNWLLNIDQQTLRRNDDAKREQISLSTADYKLLMTFLTYPKIVLSRDQLLDIVSNRESTAYDRSVDNQISRLRKKIETDPQEPELIKTVWGGGYKLAVDVIKI